MPNTEKKIENLKKANEESHSLIVDSLKSALYELLETKDINEIKVVDLTKKAGVSRGGFYRNYYLVTDVLADDIKMIAEDVRRTQGKDIEKNWEIILDTVYLHRKKIPLLLKAGMGFEILDQINQSLNDVKEENRLRITAWNGIVFNCIILWAKQGFKTSPKQLAAKMTEVTLNFF
ncbi:MAG: TetR/AcrR family transcriptional regulator [Lachnospiraceae bacterium]|nr:TetR/AcrR family transcriptional regulator [Lachnospiraceae bacterium]